MAARATALGDTGESSPEHWETPLGTPDVHVVLVGARAGSASSSRRRWRARAQAYADAAAESTPIWRQDCHALPHREGAVRLPGRHQPPGHRGQRHSRHQPARGAAQGGRVRPRLPRRDGRLPADAAARRAGPQRHLRRLPQAAPARRGVPPVPEGQRRAAAEDEELLAAKMMGRWRSGAPLALCPLHDDPGAGRRSARATTTSSIGDDADRLQDAARARTSGARTRATPPSPASSGSTG